MMLQVVITIWLGAHPFTYTLPKLYESMEGSGCISMVAKILDHRRPKYRIEAECVLTDKVEA